MSPPKAVVTQRDVTRILKGAERAGLKMSIRLRGREVIFEPMLPGTSNDEEPATLEDWLRRNAR